jgi:uncharacterized protein Smg (DUF494 family)
MSQKKDELSLQALSEIIQGIVENKSYEKIAASLKDKNVFDTHIISTAFSWVIEKLIDTRTINDNYYESQSFRFLGEHEREILGEDLSGKVQSLLQHGFFTNDDVDQIIDKIEETDFPDYLNNKAELLFISSLIEKDSLLPPGNRVFLTPFDNIN